MKKPALVALALLAAGGVAVAATRRQVAPVYEPQNLGQLDGFSTVADSIEAWTVQNLVETHSNANNTPMPHPPHLQTQIAAALAAIKHAEGTAGAGDPYRVCYAYRHTIQSFADHPAVTGEWRGEQLPEHLCRAAGLGPGCISSAAGAYQLIRPTWLRIKSRLGLRDFSPASQDAAATELLRARGALDRLAVGDFAGAIERARKEWASLPGAGYAQPERTLAWLTARFEEAGGVVVA